MRALFHHEGQHWNHSAEDHDPQAPPGPPRPRPHVVDGPQVDDIDPAVYECHPVADDLFTEAIYLHEVFQHHFDRQNQEHHPGDVGHDAVAREGRSGTGQRCWRRLGSLGSGRGTIRHIRTHISIVSVRVSRRWRALSRTERIHSSVKKPPKIHHSKAYARFCRFKPASSLTGSGKIFSPPSSSVRKFRSEEHTSELQSRGHLVCRLLLEKKNYTGNDKHKRR